MTSRSQAIKRKLGIKTRHNLSRIHNSSRSAAAPPRQVAFQQAASRHRQLRRGFDFSAIVVKMRRVLGVWAFRGAVATVLLLISIVAWQALRPGVRVRVSADTVAAFRVPHRALPILYSYAARADIPFAELLAIFNAENDFFPVKHAVYDLSQIHELYVQNFDALRRRYNARSLAPYVAMYENIFNELLVFPIPSGWYDYEPAVMFGDSWGVEHNFQGNNMHMGTAIIDRKNIRGRVPVVSMTHGRIEEAGWNNQLGYFVGVLTVNGTYYLYAHLDSLAPGLARGQNITAGDKLGQMGNTGGGRGGRSFPVHLHIAISPDAGFARGRFWINPYPLLRFVEVVRN